MADEQIIYLSPEEELTNVRERLEKLPGKRIILVIPAQTQLRSHVSWRLLHARARELNKDILIISSDRQIRSVVKAAGFKVADSLESQPSSRTRISSRAGRTNLGGKTSARLRTPPGKISTGGRSLPDEPGTPPMPPIQPLQPSAHAPIDEPQIEDLPLRRDDTTLRRMPPPASSTFEIEDVQDDAYGQPPIYPLSEPPPPVQPLSPRTPAYEEEELNPWEEDIQRARRIREAAQSGTQGDADTMLPPIQQEAWMEDRPHIQDLPSTPAPHRSADPFNYIADESAADLPEQHAALPMHELHADISDHPTDLLDIEDQGDMGDIVRRDQLVPPPWTDETDEEEQDGRGSSRIHGMRPRASRGGRVLPPEPDEGTDLPPVYDQPTRTLPQRPSKNLAPAASAGTSSGAGASRGPQPVALPSRTQPKTMPKTTTPLKKKKPETRTPAATATGRRGATTPARARAKTKPKSRAGEWVGLLVAILVVLMIVLLVLFVPSADVTVTLLSQKYSLPMKLTATGNSRQDVHLQTLAAQTLTFDSSASGSGTATGSTSVGNASASGNVSFTYNGSGQVVIPTGTLLQTKSGIQFVTGAEVLANGPPTPVQASNPGTQGNVPANSITVIPPESLSKIENYNPGVSVTSTNLTVTNPDGTGGGGAGKAPTVTNDDVNKVKSSLALQLQTQIKDFLSKNIQTGDQAGRPVLVETPVATPAAGNVATGGTFTETLKLHMTVLVARAAALQSAASAQIQAALDKEKSNSALVPQQTLLLQQMKNLSPSNGSSVIVSFTAVGQIAPKVSEDTIRSQITGRSIANATQILSGNGSIRGIENPQITVSPGFFHWLPFLSQRITVHFKTHEEVPTPKPKPTPKPTPKR